MKHDQAAAAAYLALAALVGMCSSAISAHMLRWLPQDDAAVDVCTAAGRAEWADSDFAPG